MRVASAAPASEPWRSKKLSETPRWAACPSTPSPRARRHACATRCCVAVSGASVAADTRRTAVRRCASSPSRSTSTTVVGRDGGSNLASRRARKPSSVDSHRTAPRRPVRRPARRRHVHVEQRLPRERSSPRCAARVASVVVQRCGRQRHCLDNVGRRPAALQRVVRPCVAVRRRGPTLARRQRAAANRH